MILSARDYALLSKDVYHARTVGEKVTLGSRGYTVLDSSAPSRLGFQATAYRSADRSEVIIAYRGTEFDREPFRDGEVDVAMVIAGINPQDRSAQSFTQHVMDTVRRDDELSGATTHVSVTGRSLGETLAELNAARFDLDGQTFNAYGAKGLDPVARQVTGQLTDHARAGDPVSAAALHLGNSKIYAAQRDADRMVSIAMKMMKAVTVAFAARYLTGLGLHTSSSDGINSISLQQGGLGLLLSTLIVMAPPMAAAFFQGTLGQFASYSSFGGIGAHGGYAQSQHALAQGRPPFAGPAPNNDGQVDGGAGGQMPTFGDSRPSSSSQPVFADDSIKSRDTSYRGQV